MNKKLELVLRLLVGLLLVVFGANKFLNFMPAPPLEGDIATFFAGLMASKYLMPLVGIVEVVVGLLFLLKKWMPFALVLLAPVSVNMFLTHVFLDVQNIGPAALVFLTNIVLIWAYWGKFKQLFD